MCSHLLQYILLIYCFTFQWYALVRIQDGGKWPSAMTSSLGEQTIERLTKDLQVEEGDLVAVAAGETTKPVKKLKTFREYRSSYGL